MFGMFAIAIQERDTGRVILVRDRLGIKPLYLTEGAGRVRFSSSLPSLLAAGGVDTSIDPVGAQRLHVVPRRGAGAAHDPVGRPQAAARDAADLRAGRAHQGGGLLVGLLRASAADVAKSFDDWREEVHASLRTAVQRRMIADVPVGVLLSGGVDSSVVVALLAELGHDAYRDLLDRLRERAAARKATSSSIPTSSRTSSGRRTTRSRSPSSACSTRCRARSRRCRSRW